MNNFCAIISEFNPFHNGHKYIIGKAKELSGLPVVCLMSGNFVQRGEPAIVDKFSRAKCAIEAGADVVLELPTIYALSSAHNFAYGAVKILKELGCSQLVIGVTHTNLDDYYNLAKIKNQNMKSAIQAELDKGTSYSRSLINVLKTKYPNCEKIFTDASNILALEYIGQVINQKTGIKVSLVCRTDGGYNSTKISGNFANASLLRGFIGENRILQTKKYIPEPCSWQLDNLPNIDIINSIVFYNLRNKSPEELNKYYDYTEGLPYLISSASRKCANLDACITECETKRYRKARLKKLTLYPSLNITKDNVAKITRGRPIVRLLAIRKSQKAFLSQFNNKNIKVIISRSDFEHLTASQKLSAQIDLEATNLYSIACGTNYNSDITTGTLFV